MPSKALNRKINCLTALKVIQDIATFLSGVPVKVEVSTKYFLMSKTGLVKSPFWCPKVISKPKTFLKNLRVSLPK